MKTRLTYLWIILQSVLIMGCSSLSNTTNVMTDLDDATVDVGVTGYQVWLGSTVTPKNAVILPETWENCAKLIQGVNVNRTPVKPAAGTPSEGEESLTEEEFDTFITTFDKASKNCLIPMARTFWKSKAFPDRDELAVALQNRFAASDAAGYEITSIMYFDNFKGSSSKASDGVVYRWTDAEVQKLRDWLDVNRPNVKLYSNARSNAIKERTRAESSLVDGIVLEAEPGKWLENKGNRQTLLKWLVVNEKTKDKELIFQLPVNNIEDPYGNPNAYVQMREWMKWLGGFMGYEFLRNGNVVIMPVTYNPAFTFYPETVGNNGKEYANTMTGIALSLIEQQSLFLGLEGTLTSDAIESNKRTTK